MLLVHITSSNLEHNQARKGAGGAISVLITMHEPPTTFTLGLQPYLASLDFAIVISGSTLSNNRAQSAGALSLRSVYNGSKGTENMDAVCGQEIGGAGSLLGFLDLDSAALLWPETSSCRLEVNGGTVIDGNRAVNGSGGGIILAGCAARIHGCRISNNSAIQGGGGLVYIDSGLSAAGLCSEVTTSTSSFNQTLATLDEGGAMLLLVDNSKLVDNIVAVVDTFFDRNRAATQGGAVSMLLLSAYGLDNALLLSQEASQGQHPSVVIVHSTFTVSVAGTYGGGVHVLAACSGQLLICESSTFANNTAAFGGAISAHSMAGMDGDTTCSTTAGLVLKSAVVLYNSAQNGGGLHLAQGATAVVDGTTFQENIAEFLGGAIASVDCGLITLTNSCITGCSAGLLGGGIYAGACMLVLVERSHFNQNRAAVGGGVYLSGIKDTSGASPLLHVAPVAIFSHANFSENTASWYHASTNASTVSTAVRQVISQYLGHGGGMFINGYIGVVVSNNTVTYGNSASAGTVIASAQVPWISHQ
ncbi:hypothetical protein TSOC_009997 [Tetrabaena socialis]|uniref:Uncharacterized protein n=1 Tax=Tetrabaena socialis TaxID=47790 RepID=A0A2J7ZUH4_9CHLO|nr:hypothetical protein TSOC_009997 [Tetrabaena socialis]|eukprot:PNH03926.1 hypothetical protein TSOC_009997 [Tetrabaena socialis]